MRHDTGPQIAGADPYPMDSRSPNNRREDLWMDRRKRNRCKQAADQRVLSMGHSLE